MVKAKSRVVKQYEAGEGKIERGKAKIEDGEGKIEGCEVEIEDGEAEIEGGVEFEGGEGNPGC